MIGPSSQISKILLTLLFLLIIFYVFMDVELYLRIHNYTIERNYHTNVSTSSVSAQSTSESGSSTKLPTAEKQPSYEDHTWISCDINPSVMSRSRPYSWTTPITISLLRWPRYSTM